MKITSFACLFFISVIFFNGRKQDYGYIHLVYISEQGKPFPQLKFFLPSSMDTIYEREVVKIKTSEKEFEGIKQSIEEKKAFIKDTILFESFQYIIFQNGETTIIMTPYLSRIRKIFDNIVNQIENSDQRELLRTEFNYILKRLESEIRLK